MTESRFLAYAIPVFQVALCMGMMVALVFVGVATQAAEDLFSWLALGPSVGGVRCHRAEVAH